MKRSDRLLLFTDFFQWLDRPFTSVLMIEGAALLDDCDLFQNFQYLLKTDYNKIRNQSDVLLQKVNFTILATGSHGIGELSSCETF